MIGDFTIQWPNGPEPIPGFRSMKRLVVFLLPPGWSADPSLGYPQHKFSGTHLYRGGWREAVSCPEHNTIFPARTRTRTTRSGVKRTNHEASHDRKGKERNFI